LRWPARHLKTLKSAGTRWSCLARRDAQRRPVRVEAKPLEEATDWLDNYRRSLESSYQRLDALLVEMKAVHQQPGRSRRPAKRAATRKRRS